jgi:hypothetical protein
MAEHGGWLLPSWLGWKGASGSAPEQFTFCSHWRSRAERAPGAGPQVMNECLCANTVSKYRIKKTG